ncbi:hypothetical protein Tco_0543385 [Tanacetum coccineum]
MQTACGDGVTITKRRRQDLHRDGIRDPAMALGHGRLKEDLESSTFYMLLMLLLVDGSIEQFLNNFANQPYKTNMNDLESDDKSVDTPLVSPFPHSDNDSDDGEVLNELSEYENAGALRRERIINGFDGDDLAFQCMIGFRNSTLFYQ